MVAGKGFRPVRACAASQDVSERVTARLFASRVVAYSACMKECPGGRARNVPARDIPCFQWVGLHRRTTPSSSVKCTVLFTLRPSLQASESVPFLFIDVSTVYE